MPTKVENIMDNLSVGICVNITRTDAANKKRTGKSYQNVLAREFQTETEPYVVRNAGINRTNEKRAND